MINNIVRDAMIGLVHITCLTKGGQL